MRSKILVRGGIPSIGKYPKKGDFVLREYYPEGTKTILEIVGNPNPNTGEDIMPVRCKVIYTNHEEDMMYHDHYEYKLKSRKNHIKNFIILYDVDLYPLGLGIPKERLVSNTKISKRQILLEML